MKKLLLLALSSAAFLANADDLCAADAQKIVNRMHSHNVTSVNLNYSADKAAMAQSCQKDVAALDKSLTLSLKQVDGQGVFKFSRK